MMRRYCLTLLAVILCWPLIGAASGVRRVALLVGANDGGADRVRLRYAIDDANALQAVLRELGGIEAQDLKALAEPSRAELVDALRTTAGVLKGMSGRVEFVFYYSGHSDDQGLLLGGERLGYGELRRLINQLPATVRIAIVDACASGALTRAKGGVRRAPFLLDESNAVAGSAILTSASADEAAQESDRIKGSFFTHALLSGLRGAADRSGDGRVTLTEAYQFAYAETLARTETTRLGAQHPNYDLQLSGRGEVVLTDVRSTAAGMVFAPELVGRFAVRAVDGQLIAELSKTAGRPLELGLPAGRYQIFRHEKGQAARADVEVESGRRVRLASAQFGALQTVMHRARGGSASDVDHWDLNLVGGGDALDGTEFGLINHRSGWVRGVQVGVLSNFAAGGVDGSQIATIFNGSGQGVDGVQVAALVNHADGLVDGAQVSTAVNIAGSVDGAQVTGAVNVAEAINGAQVAGAVNVADRVDGAQVAGAVNVAGPVDGVQIGIVNIGDTIDGAQIGVVNIANRVNGAPIGLINIVGEGVHAIEAWTSDQDRTNLGLRLGSQAFQTVFAVGTTDTRSVRPGVGLGGRIRLPARLDLTLDAMAWGPYIGEDWSQIESSADFLFGGRLLVGWRFKILRIFGGPVARFDHDRTRTVTPDGRTIGQTDTLRVTPGFAVGIALF